VLICCVDRNTSRVAAGQLAMWYHKTLLDIGTGTFFYPTPGEMSGRPDRTQGIDIRPIVPGDECLLCWVQAATDLAHNRTLGIQRQRQEERAGSLLALNHMAAARGILLLQALVSERIQASRWEQIAIDANGRLLPHDALARQTAVTLEMRHRGAPGLLLTPSAQVSCQLLPHCWINPTPSRPPQCSDTHRHPGIGR
jgi:hypothetical protein